MFGILDDSANEQGDFNSSDSSFYNVSIANGSANTLPNDVRIEKNPFPMHQFLWRIGIIFAISGLIILGSFVAMFGFSYSRRRRMFRRRRHRNTSNLSFENQLSVTQDETDPEQTRTRDEDHVTPVHSSCHVHRWAREGNTTRSRSRSRSPGNPRSPRATSPQSHSRRASHRPPEDDMLMASDSVFSGMEKLDNARLAFKEDASKYAEYDSTKEIVKIGV